MEATLKKQFTLLAVLVTFAAGAQPERGSRAAQRERIESAKIAYLTNALELSVEESQKFWPVYNEMQSKEMELREGTRENMETLSNMDENTSEKTIEKTLLDLGQAHIAIEQLHLDYLDDFIAVIGARKTAQFMRAEREFGRKIMEGMQRDGRGMQRPDGRRPDHDARMPQRPRP